MKNVFLVFYFAVLILFNQQCFSQKMTVSDTSYRSWTTVAGGTLSCDGIYMFYTINNEPLGGRTTILTATDKSWELKSSNYSNCKFSNDSRFCFLMAGEDSLMRVDLKTRKTTLFALCQSYELYSHDQNEWIIYRTANPSNDLKIENIRNYSEILLSNVYEYQINRKGQSIVTKSKDGLSSDEILYWTDLVSGKSKLIYKGQESGTYIFNRAGTAMAFGSQLNGIKNIWYYDIHANKSRLILTDTSRGLRDDYEVAFDIFNFSSDGKDIFFNQKRKNTPIETVDPTVWSYEDAYLRPQYDGEIGRSSIIRGNGLSIVNLKTNVVRQLLSGTQKLRSGINDVNTTDILVVTSSFGRIDELPWNKYAPVSYYLLSTKTGVLLPVKLNALTAIDLIELSPDGKWLLYFDAQIDHYKAYNTKTAVTKTIGENMDIPLEEISFSFRYQQKGHAAGLAYWLSNNDVVIQGTHDLLKFSLLTNSVTNLTSKYRNGDNKVFSPINLPSRYIDAKDADILIVGFNLVDKTFDVYNMNVMDNVMKKMFTSKTALARPYDKVTPYIQKCGKSVVFLIATESSNSSLNYVLVRNQIFDTITSNFPEKKFNWITSELIKYDDGIGNTNEGILWKPENFDEKRKYPVIFYYYTDYSNLVNKYLSPQPSSNGINIPLLVSNGYIVCTPNIYRVTGEPGESALRGVISAANYLSSFSWANTEKMAVAGHSLGGFETNYIVSHTTRFAAAYAPSGISNLIELYNEHFGIGFSMQPYCIYGGYVMGAGLDQIPENYIKNSPILASKNINTPLLLMHNLEDDAVPVTHSEQLFVQLRSLNKPTWLLQYAKEKHTVETLSNQLDLQLKVKAFFDHYLKDVQMPKWMIEHIRPEE
jgi:dienelactone hydrolase